MVLRGPYLALALALVACRINFDPVGDTGTAARCTPPPYPDTSAPDHVVGTGSAASCTEQALRDAIALGGVIAFDCGANATIVLTGELVVSAPDTVLVGPIHLDANGAGRAIHGTTSVAHLTLVGLTITGGATTGHGAGVYVQAGALLVIDSVFEANIGPTLDVFYGGGAIAADPSDATIAVYRSRFTGNRAANGGAIKLWGNLTVVDTVFTNNAATGTGGNAGSGGLGGAIEAVGVADNTFCGVTISSNMAGDTGGGYLRISTNMFGSDHWEQSSIVGNTAMSEAGGMYVQDIAIDLDRVVVASNRSAGLVGGIHYVGATGPFVARTIEIVDNTAALGLGAGLTLGTVPGSIAFSTIANNHANCPSCWAAAIDGGGQTLTASVIADNTIQATNAIISCRMPLAEGGANFQWPDDGAALCTPSARVIDPMLGELVERGGYLVAPPRAGSPVIAAASDCPALDIAGKPRPQPCAAGAVEP